MIEDMTIDQLKTRLAQERKNVESLTALTERLMDENEKLKMLIPWSAEELEDDAEGIRELFLTGAECEALWRQERHNDLVYRDYQLRRAMRCEDCPHGSR